MEISSKSFDVFDFKEDDELPEIVAAKYTSKSKNPNHIDKYMFLENVAKGTHNQSKEVGNVLCVDVDAIDSDHNYNGAISTLLDAVEDCATDRTTSLDAVLQIKSSPEKQPQVRAEKLEPGSMYTRLEGRSSPGPASPDYSQLNCASQESPSSHPSVGVVSDTDECASERSASTSSNVAEDDVSFDGPSSDHCFSGWEMGDRDAEIVFYPDYIVYRDIYCTDSELSFSSCCIEIKGSIAHGNQGTFNFQWEIDDIVDIESQWCGRLGMAMMNINIISKDTVQAGIMCSTSGIEELKLSVCDSNWYQKQEAITSLDVKYKAMWNVVFDTDMKSNGDAEFGQNGVLFPKRYFPNFDEPFEDVVYPLGDSDAVCISKRDVDLLQPDTFVNDTIIDFYIKYLKNKILPEERHRFHFFNSFFFRKLADLDKDPASASGGRAAFERVRKWTRKVNLFEKDYIFIPVNFNYHWSLIVICHPGEVAKFQDEDIEKSLKVPCILHMDSIKGSHTGLKGLVQSYLCEEWKEKQKETSEDISARYSNLRFLSLELPQQQNSFDCGLFLLHYVELFLEESPANFSPFKITTFSKFLNVDWFPPAEPSLKRVHIERLIYDLLENRSCEISPANGSDRQCASNSLEDDNDTETPVQVISEGCSPSKGYYSNSQSSQDAQAIEMTLLPTSSLKSSQYANDSGLILREFFEPGDAARSFFNAQDQAFDLITSFNEFKSDTSLMEEEVEANDHIVYSPSTETGLRRLAENTPEACAASPYSSRDFEAVACWNPGNSVHHKDVDSSFETSSCASDDSLEVDVNERGQIMEDLSLEVKIYQPRSPSTENTECLTGCLASTPCELLGASDSERPDQMLDGNVNADVLTSCLNNLPSFSHQGYDLQENAHDDVCLIDDDSVSELDYQHVAKRMRFTPPLEGKDSQETCSMISNCKLMP